MKKVVMGLFIASLIGLVSVEILHLAILRIVLKTITSVLFVLFAFLCYDEREEQQRFAKFLLCGLICSLFGDIFMALNPYHEIFMSFGIVTFAMAQVMYIIGFTTCVRIHGRDFAMFLIIFLIIVATMTFGSFEFDGIYGAVLGYAAIISFMVVKAISLFRYYQNNRKLVVFEVTGAVLFLLSDLILLFYYFYTKQCPWLRGETNYVVYYPAQILIASGIRYQYIKK